MKILKKILKPFLKPIKILVEKRIATKRLKKAMLTSHNEGPIVFICQCEYIWNKTRNVFAELVKNKKNVYLYVIKDEQSVSKKDITIFEEEFPSYVIKHEDVALVDLHPSIVVYSRPYPNYLPKNIRINNVLKYALTSYIPYYYSLDNLVEMGINDEFYRYLSIYFADQDEIKEHFDNLQAKNIKKGYQIAYNCGFPIFEKLYDNVSKNSIYKNSFGKFKVMWAPRWTMDEKLGGSNFMKYYKKMFDYFINNDKFSFVFRPHPLLFGNFVVKGYITKEEKDSILSLLENSSNSVHDTTSDYINTFYNTDVLICDNSSIVVEYFLSGNPMIYCYNDSAVTLNKQMNKILECNYVVNSFDEILFVLTKLINGQDEKKEIREKYLNDFLEEHKSSAIKIAEKLDLYSNNNRK